MPMMRTRGQATNEARRKDISLGRELNPIPVECPPDLRLPRFEYITKHQLCDYNPPIDRSKKVFCDCDGPCTPDEKCQCLLFNSTQSQLIECSDSCGCSANCNNRKYFNASLPMLKLKYIDETFNFGVFAAEIIKKGTYCGSYHGEIFEVNSKTKFEESDYTFFVFSKVSHSNVEINATKKGSITRFFNHSCRKNLDTIMVHYGREKWIHPVFIARRDIAEGEQLTIDYGKNYFAQKGEPCLCGNCRRSIS